MPEASYPLGYDIVMLGTFSTWRLGTLQARALPIATELTRQGLRCAIVTVPYDQPNERGMIDSMGGVPIINTQAVQLASTANAVSQLIDIVRRLRPRVIHIFKPKGFPALAYPWLRWIAPVVVDSDDWEGDGGWNRQGRYNLVQRRLFEYQERTLIARADAVTAASTLLARRATQLRRSRRHPMVHRLQNGLSEDWFHRLEAARPRQDRAHGGDADPSSVVIYSRFEEFGEDWLSRLVLALRMTARPLKVVVVGPSPELVPSRAGTLDVDRLGYVAKNALPSVLGSATVALIPYDDGLVTRSKHSVKLLELMAAGCPVIASDVGDIAEVLGPGGVTIPGAVPEQMAAAAMRLLAANLTRQAMSLAGPQRVRDNFTTRRSADAAAIVYRELTASRA